MPAKVSVKGQAETARAFDKLQNDVSDLQATHEKVARARLGGVQSRTPILTGALASSFQIDSNNTGGSIISPLPYAPIIEYGWESRNISAARMVADTLQAEQSELLAEYEQAILDRAKARGFRIG